MVLVNDTLNIRSAQQTLVVDLADQSSDPGNTTQRFFKLEIETIDESNLYVMSVLRFDPMKSSLENVPNSSGSRNSIFEISVPIMVTNNKYIHL